MTITNTQSGSTLSSYQDAASSGRVPKKTLGQEDFLKLITVQLTKQDPMKPMEDTSFMAQMAQFSALEQSSQMAKDMAAIRTDFSLQSAAGMLGRQVTLDTKNGSVAGVVDAVDSSDGTVKVGVGGLYYPLSQVVRVAPAVVVPATQTKA
jgi:flagellar basal-body rod modification protein FlgD